MEWKDVVGYEGIYEVSDTGEVRTKEGKTTYTERHGVRRWKQRTLKQKVSKDNTCRVSLWKGGKEELGSFTDWLLKHSSPKLRARIASITLMAVG